MFRLIILFKTDNGLLELLKVDGSTFLTVSNELMVFVVTASATFSNSGEIKSDPLEDAVLTTFKTDAVCS